MAEQNPNDNKNFSIQKIHCKDISFETPNSPKIFTEKWEPSVDFHLSSDANSLEDTIYEVSITATITVKCGDSTAYLIEVCQAGVFTLSGFNEQELGPMLGSFCPNILFPYLREVVSDLVNKGGFPQLLLAPVNFDALYAQKLQQMQQQAPTSETIN